MWDRISTAATRAARMSDLFDADPDRAAAFAVETEGMRLDYSKTTLDADARDLLLALLAEQGLAARRDAMFKGAPINETEHRAVLHTALRARGDAPLMVEGADIRPGIRETRARINETEHRAVLHTALRARSGPPILVDGADILPGIRDTRARMAGFAREIRAGGWSDVVTIGIGGSHLGPEMATRALAPYHDGPRCHFVSNVDGADMSDTLARLDPARVFGFGDYVGGRYSVWGPVGLPLMIAIGPEGFDAFLDGAAAMDAHFREAPPEANMPVMLALTGLWHHQGCGHATRAVLPYDQRLARLPAYLQQLEMESNGKRVTLSGAPAPGPTGPVVWGEPGTNGQHAFYQLIHQGTQVVPCEFMVAATGHEPALAHHHRLLVANCLAQSEALMRGRSRDEARAMMRAAGYAGAEAERQAAHRVFPGNRPSTTLIYDRLKPYRLGQILALYEHRVFVEGTALGINSFDQWGVELGKVLAAEMAPLLDGAEDSAKDGSTRALLAFVRGVTDRSA